MRAKLCFLSILSIFVAAEAQYYPPGNDYTLPWNDAEVDQEIVDYALSQIFDMKNCFNIQTKNFQVQVSSMYNLYR